MEIKHYRLIKTIAEEGSIANSSSKLFLSQSALSHQLRELEEQLGFKVFFRTRNKWELSEQGQELYQLANTIFTAIEEGFSNVRHINEGAKGKIRISTECYSLYQGIPEFIQKMTVLYPDIEVELELLSEAHFRPLPKLIANEIDMAFVTEKVSSNLISSIELYEDEVICVMNKEHRLAEKTHLEPGDFSDLHLIIHSYPLESVVVYEKFLKPNKMCPNKISAIPFTAMSLEMVAANMGVMCVPRWSLSAFNLTEKFVFKTISKHGLKKTQYLIYRTEDINKRYIKDFIDNIQEEFLD